MEFACSSPCHSGSALMRSPAEVHALLLSDVVVLLQEKDQKLVFAAMVSVPQMCSVLGLLLQIFAPANGSRRCRFMSNPGQQTTHHLPQEVNS